MNLECYKENPIFKDLYEEIKKMPVIDTHEHLEPEKTRVERKIDFFNIVLSHYLSSDLVSAGMPCEDIELLRNVDVDFETKIKRFMPLWEKTKNTSYSRIIKIAVKDLYDIDEITPKTLPEINTLMISQNKQGLYKQILRDKLNIDYCVWDYDNNSLNANFFKVALRLDNIINVTDQEDIIRLQKKFGKNIESPSALEEMFEVNITNLKNEGLVALKCGLAYERTLAFEPVSRTEAVLAMDKILRGRFLESDSKILQDYLMYSLAEKAGWHNLPLQIHTGIQEGNGNMIRNSNPALLSKLIKANPNTRFDLFHGGYPFGGETSALAKMFKNVYLDLSWVHAISSSYTRRYLSEWLETVPVCKILGFGGDYNFVEGVYGHMVLAKENIAHVLADKVSDGIFSKEEALQYARMMLHDNAAELFG